MLKFKNLQIGDTFKVARSFIPRYADLSHHVFSKSGKYSALDLTAGLNERWRYNEISMHPDEPVTRCREVVVD